jgi:hypothetical protein
MSIRVRLWLLALVAGSLVAIAASPAQGAVGIEKFVAVTCAEGFEECAEEPAGSTFFGPVSVPKEPSQAEAEAEGFTQAGGHVPLGITDFKLTTTGEVPNEVPTGVATHIRTDVAPGLATSPAAVPQCDPNAFGETEAIPGTGFYGKPNCLPETEVGENEATVYAGPTAGDVPLHGSVFNLVQRQGLASEFGVALELPVALTKGALEKAFAEKGHPLGEATEKFLEEKQYFGHTLIEGNVEWGVGVTLGPKGEPGTNQGDYHDFFEINISPALPLIRSRLIFFGTRGEGDFITNATSCPGNNTTTLKIAGTEGPPAARTYTTPIGLSGCNLVPFEPSFSVVPATSANDQPNGFTTELGLTRHPAAEEIDASQLKTAVVQTPEGMTLNESAAAGLTACTPAQARIHSPVAGVACPEASQLGTVSIEVPTLPPGSLAGNIYLGGPESGSITGPPFIVYLDAESARYGVSVRLKGEVIPNEATGQLTTVFSENPEQPFTKVTLHFKEGALAPLANPLVCGTAITATTLTPFSGTSAQTPASSFTVDSDGKGGACSSPLPFSVSQSTQNQNPNAGGHTSYTFNLSRSDGQQRISQVKTILPAGLVGAIPLVTQCGEPQAKEGTCATSSQIGTATVQAGAGPTPFTFSGPVYLTGPYNGAPFGLSIAVPAIAGPFNLGVVVTRATINVDPLTARVIVTSVLPRIVKGVPIRIKNISVAVNKQGFLFNPTYCGALATESTLSGFTLVTGGITGTQSLTTPFSLRECGKLAFKPAFTAASNAKTSKANGASLETTINQPAGQANIRSVKVQLPIKLPSRLTTLQKACLAATFEADPFHCPSGSFVGGVRANTPTLPAKMTGPAILVSHAAAAFPDLDLVLEGNGVRVILVGNTNIKRGITTTTFASTPDVPVSSVTVNLPTGSHSALAAFGDLCASPLLMPTTIVGWNGSTINQNTRIKVKGCGIRVLRRKVVGANAFITVQTFAGGRISGRGGSLSVVYRRVRGAAKVTIKVPLSRRGRHRHRPFSTRARVGFLPSNRAERASAAFASLRFR